MSSLRSCGSLLAVAIALWAHPGAAQDSAAAEALFQNALTQMDARQYVAACPMFAESYRLDPRPGTLFTLAECEAASGKLSSAIAHYSDYLQVFARMPADQRARQLDRDKVAHDQIAKLQPLIPQLILTLPAKAPAGTLVRRGDVLLQRPSFGIPLPVDPGEHVITTQAPGGALKTLRITIGPGETRRIELEVDVPVVPGATAGGSRQQDPAAPPLPSWAHARASLPQDSGSGDRKVWAYIAGGLALEGIAVGTVAGLLAWDKKKTIDAECVGTVCSADGKEAGDSARTMGTLSTIGFGIGGVALASAIVLWMTDSPRPRESTRVAPMVTGGNRAAMIGVSGGF